MKSTKTFTFEERCRPGGHGFTAAGRQLGISPSAVGKAIARLEERVGVRLLHRSTRSIAPTPEGAQFLQRCQRIFSEVDAAELELPATAVTSVVEALIDRAEQGVGLACAPAYAVRRQLDEGLVTRVLDGFIANRGTLRILWPSSRHRSPKVKAFVECDVDREGSGRRRSRQREAFTVKGKDRHRDAVADHDDEQAGEKYKQALSHRV